MYHSRDYILEWEIAIREVEIAGGEYEYINLKIKLCSINNNKIWNSKKDSMGTHFQNLQFLQENGFNEKCFSKEKEEGSSDL